MRRSFQTRLFGQADAEAAVDPPPALFEKVHFDAPLGKNVAYVSPRSNGKRPAIVWIHGGLDWGIGSIAWEPAERNNDQSARAFREAGVVLMLPSLRGSNDSPGRNECFLGEVDDVIAAGAYLAKRPDVDPKRVYLGGHSTGATLALLVAASTDEYRAVFALGPIADPRQYGRLGCVPEGAPEDEVRLRAPIEWIRDIVTPTFVIEGENGNALPLAQLQGRADGGAVEFRLIPGATHFDIIAPVTELIAAQILADTQVQPHFDLDADKLTRALRAEH